MKDTIAACSNHDNLLSAKAKTVTKGKKKKEVIMDIKDFLAKRDTKNREIIYKFQKKSIGWKR
ncbi:MAG: hypothetical protein ACYST3_01295 [Planctomycetota bacterium]|jgi:hypothetical protein